MELEATQNKLKNGYDSLLLSYAAGTLDMAQNLIVESHLTFSNEARSFVRKYEMIGGALIENECESVDMSIGSLDNVLARLDSQNSRKQKERSDFTHSEIHFDIPAPLKNRLNAQKRVGWKPLMPGFKAYDIDLECKKSTARFMQVAPGTKSPHHSHGGMEITLVLDGAFTDETGDYKIGDMIVTDDTIEHSPVACKMDGCTCLVVSTAPIKLSGIASLLNPFLKP